MTVEVTRLGDNPGDTAASIEIERVARTHDVPDFPTSSPRADLKRLRHDWPGTVTYRFIATDTDAGTDTGAGPVGTLAVTLPQLENTHLADVELTVAPPARRRGVGRALLATATAFAREHGRRTLQGTTLDDSAAPRGQAAFAEAMGATVGLATARRRLDLDTVDRLGWDALRSAAQERAGGYHLRRWAGATPDDFVADVATLDSRVLLDIPVGELALEAEQIDVARTREIEAALRTRGRRAYHCGAIEAGTGRVVAWTLITYDCDSTDQCWQQITIVDPDHRGHRLGLLVKLDNLAHALEHEPGTRHVDTFNALDNARMIAIDDELGFRLSERWLIWQAQV